MDEVIVRTGFENIDKRKLTSSVVTVKMDDIMEPITTTLDKMLQGKIPGNGCVTTIFYGRSSSKNSNPGILNDCGESGTTLGIGWYRARRSCAS